MPPLASVAAIMKFSVPVTVIMSVRMLAPRSRFRPVKTTNELTLVRSDLFRFEPDWRVAATTERPDPLIDLSSEFAFVDDLERLFPAGVPSLRECDSLRVRGAVTFGADVTCRGDVVVDGPALVPDGAVIGGQAAYPSGSGG